MIYQIPLQRAHQLPIENRTITRIANFRLCFAQLGDLAFIAMNTIIIPTAIPTEPKRRIREDVGNAL